jgi:hypothetical protein
LSTLQSVRRFLIAQHLVDETGRALRHAGEEGYELFVLWTGCVRGDVLQVRTCHVPRQTSRKTRRGLLVRVDGQALHELNVWLYEHGEVLGAQVHAHPTDAYHSDTDDEFPIVTSLGGLSLVVADFARDGVLTSQSAAYRLEPSGWEPVALDTIEVTG